MHNRFIISLICCLLPALAWADASEVRDNAPDSHVVVKGDTLWDISAKFFKSPWKWPQIWGMNKDIIRDPHWIYPGQVIVLDRASGTLHVSGGEENAGMSPSVVVKLSPRARVESSGHGAIPVIPLKDIGPFLDQPLVVEDANMAGAPTLVGAYEQRVILGNDDVAFVKGLTKGSGSLWQIYRPGKTFVDPDSNEILGHEAIYLGDAQVEKFADISTIRITKAIQEINRGDRLVQTTGMPVSSFAPHAPQTKIAAQIISIYGGVSEGGRDNIVTLNKGQRDGLENGHVLALYHKEEATDDNLSLPDTRSGLIFIFRTFEKVSYGLVMEASLPVALLDRAQTP
jgi:hypothetical protein